MVKCFFFSFYALLIIVLMVSLDLCGYYYYPEEGNTTRGSAMSLLYTRAISMTVSTFTLWSLLLLPFCPTRYLLLLLILLLLVLLPPPPPSFTSYSSTHLLVYSSTHCKILFLACNINAAVKNTTPSYSYDLLFIFSFLFELDLLLHSYFYLLLIVHWKAMK